jgi:drug/metabolite transporter (DMT)-like permease
VVLRPTTLRLAEPSCDSSPYCGYEIHSAERLVPLTSAQSLPARITWPTVPARYRDAGLFVLLAALFGSGFVAIETGLRELPPVLFASLRFDIAALALLSYVVLTRPRASWLPRTRGDLLGVGVAGLFLVALNNSLLFLGQGTITPGMASIMYGLNPVLAPVFAWWLLGDRISWPGALGIGIALSGVVIIVQPSASTVTDASALGQFLVMGAAAAAALGSVLLQRVSPQVESIALTGWGMALGAALLHGVSLVAGEPQTSVVGIAPVTVLSLFVIGIPSTAVAYAIHFGLLARVGPVRANLVAYVVPVFAALTGLVLLGTAVSAWTAVGFLVVVAGFVVVERDTLRREVVRLRTDLGGQEPQEPTPSAAPPSDD